LETTASKGEFLLRTELVLFAGLYLATVQRKRSLVMGKAYTSLLDLKPGDEFEIKLGRKQIRLVPVGADEEN